MNDLSALPDENSKRFVAVLNEKIEPGKLMNALGHMAAGIAGANSTTHDFCFLQYKDKEDGLHPNISHFPFIILKAENSNQIKKLRNEVIARGLLYTDFTRTMTVGSSAAQLAATAETCTEELEYFGICIFAETSSIKEITKRFSLFK